jgi:hypothetical protein
MGPGGTFKIQTTAVTICFGCVWSNVIHSCPSGTLWAFNNKALGPLKETSYAIIAQELEISPIIVCSKKHTNHNYSAKEFANINPAPRSPMPSPLVTDNQP